MLRLVRGHHGISTSAFKTWSNICDHRLQRIPTETYEMSGKVATSLGTNAQIFSLQCGGRSCRSSLFSEALPLPSATSVTLASHSAGDYILPTQKAYSSTFDMGGGNVDDLDAGQCLRARQLGEQQGDKPATPKRRNRYERGHSSSRDRCSLG